MVHQHVDQGSRCISVSERLVQVLQHQGSRRVFGIPGGTISPVFDRLNRSGIEVVQSQHESLAVYAASGESLATGRPGVVLVTSGPGVLNAVTGIAAAQQDGLPVVLLAGEVAVAHAGRGALQDGGPLGLGVHRIFEPLCKAVWRLDDPETAETQFTSALALAAAEPRGPVVLTLPMDVARAKVRGTQRASTPVRSSLPTPDLSDLVLRVREARHPTIFAGYAAVRAGLGRQLEALCEHAGIALVTDIEGRGLVAEDHPLHQGVFGVGAVGPAARWLAERADLVVALGARLDDTSTLGWSNLLTPQGGLIHLHPDPTVVGRAYPDQSSYCCDLAYAVNTLHGALGPGPRPPCLSWDPLPTPRTARGRPLDPRMVVQRLGEIAGPDQWFVSDIGNHLLFLASGLRLRERQRLQVSQGLGGMGSGIGMAIGLAAAGESVIAVCGDGSALMSGNELATAVRHQLPLRLVVFNDGQLGMVEHGMARLYGRGGDCVLPSVDFAGWATALGAHSVRLRHLDELDLLLRDAPGPMVVEVPIDPSVQAPNARIQALGGGVA